MRTSTGPARVALTATVAALVLQPFVAGSAFASVTNPVPTRPLPATTDVAASYQDQRSCDPAAKRGVEAYAQLVMSTYGVGHSGGIVRGCGIGATSEHKEGRAFDYMLSVNVPAEKAAGDALTSWLTGTDSQGVIGGNARRLGVMYVIWNRRIWSTYSAGSGWRAYSGASSHTDHVHTSFSWDGAESRTSWWDGTAVTVEDKGTCRVYAGQPAPVYTSRNTTACTSILPAAPASPYAIVWPGQSGSTVKVAQTKLGLTADGVFGSGTRTRLMSWQGTKSVPVTGVLDKPTWAKLVPSTTTPPVPPLPPPPVPAPGTTPLTPYKGTVLQQGSSGAAVVALQKALKITADGAFGPGTASAVKAFQTSAKLPATGVVTRPTWDALELKVYLAPAPAPAPAPKPAPKPPAPADPLLTQTSVSAYKDMFLKSGSRGAAVRALRTALGMAHHDPVFGAGTERTVMAFQRSQHMSVTGTVGHPTWNAVEQVAYPLLRYRSTVLRVGSTGKAVQALQRALHLTADGAFGLRTEAAVKALQVKAKLGITGVVGVHTWRAIEARAYPLGAKRW